MHLIQIKPNILGKYILYKTLKLYVGVVNALHLNDCILCSLIRKGSCIKNPSIVCVYVSVCMNFNI